MSIPVWPEYQSRLLEGHERVTAGIDFGVPEHMAITFVLTRPHPTSDGKVWIVIPHAHDLPQRYIDEMVKTSFKEALAEAHPDGRLSP